VVQHQRVHKNVAGFECVGKYWRDHVLAVGLPVPTGFQSALEYYLYLSMSGKIW